VSSAGDVDGDDRDDLLIAAPYNDEGGSSAGKTYLFFGSTVAGGGSFDLSQADASFVGESASDASGYSVSSAGDVDGDGLDDLLIGAPIYGTGYFTEAGKTYLVFGSTVGSGGSFSLSAADAVFMGEEGWDGSGTSVSSAGDVDGDGLDDLLIGAPYNNAGTLAGGKTYLFLGATVAGGGSFDMGSADAIFLGERRNDYSGLSVSSAGDVDGDGLDDLLIGARLLDVSSAAGKTYLLLASTVAGGGTFDLSVADARFLGENAGDLSGTSVSSAGDVDGDGLDDLLIGAPGYGGSNDDGKAYLILSPY